MTAHPSWTPASRPGIVPLHPLSFGTVLGRSFAALRQNPRVLLGFAVVVQVVVYLLIVAVVAAVSVWAFSRLATVPQDTEAYRTITAGSVAIVVIAAAAMSIVAAATGVIVQAVVVTDVAHAVVAERLRLSALWHRVRPVAWRLVGYTLLVALALVVAVGAVTAVVAAVSAMAPAVAIALTVLAVLAAVPVVLWLSTKLLLVAPVIILEHATIGPAIARSWRLTRGRFWPILGVIVLVQVIFGALAQIVTIPFALVGGVLGTLVAPTGDATTRAIVAAVVTVAAPQVVGLLIQSVGAVVQATATGLLYIDARMRREGLDLDLLAYVERRDAGTADGSDPYTLHIGRAFVRPPSAYPPPGPYPPGAYPPPGASPSPDSPPPAPTQWAPPGGAP